MIKNYKTSKLKYDALQFNQNGISVGIIQDQVNKSYIVDSA